jgi:hypothetical protein
VLPSDEKIREISEADLCHDIDGHIHSIYNSKDPRKRLAMRPQVIFIYQTYIASSPDKAKFFPRFLRQKAKIVCDIIFDEETREIVSSLAVFPKEEIRKVVDDAKRKAAEAQLEKQKSPQEPCSTASLPERELSGKGSDCDHASTNRGECSADEEGCSDSDDVPKRAKRAMRSSESDDSAPPPRRLQRYDSSSDQG